MLKEEKTCQYIVHSNTVMQRTKTLHEKFVSSGRNSGLGRERGWFSNVAVTSPRQASGITRKRVSLFTLFLCYSGNAKVLDKIVEWSVT